MRPGSVHAKAQYQTRSRGSRSEQERKRLLNEGIGGVEASGVKASSPAESVAANCPPRIDGPEPVGNIIPRVLAGLGIEMPQQAIADQVGCSQMHVSRVQKELKHMFKLDMPDTRVGKDGKERPTTYQWRHMPLPGDEQLELSGIDEGGAHE